MPKCKDHRSLQQIVLIKKVEHSVATSIRSIRFMDNSNDEIRRTANFIDILPTDCCKRAPNRLPKYVE